MGVDTLISAGGFAIGLLLAGLIAGAPKYVAPGGRWLAAALLCFALLALGDWLESSRVILIMPHLGHVTDPLILLLGPLMLAYVRELTGRMAFTWKQWFLHALPFLLLIALLLPLFYLIPGTAKRQLLERDLSQPVAFDPTLTVAALLVLGYLIAALVTLRRYRIELLVFYSSIETRTYRRIGLMLWVVSGLWAVWVLAIVGVSEWARWLNRLDLPIAMYALGWFGLRQRLVQFDHHAPPTTTPAALPLPLSGPPTPVPANPEATRPTKYQRSGLTAERAADHRRQLESIMAIEKPYLETDLTLAQLAMRVGVSAHHLSQLFNEQMGLTFFDYVNARRVEDVKRCLADPAYDGQAVLSIALASGFNSKTAFNAAFRKHTGQTPSAFRASRTPKTSP